uniref:Uncharacterized protein n=1 Tax=Micrurus lemniscatus lemniscatus TaxID=129467 RepID=A0A2D4HWI8_MICLE
MWKIGYKIIGKEHDSLSIHCQIDTIQTEYKMQCHSYSSIQKYPGSKVCFIMEAAKNSRIMTKELQAFTFSYCKHSWVFYKEKNWTRVICMEIYNEKSIGLQKIHCCLSHPA